MRSPKSSLRRPAAARIRQAYEDSGSSSLASRVPTLPRTSSKLRWGYRFLICALRRTEEVPTTLPSGRSSRDL